MSKDSTSLPVTAAQLKDEGNVFFAQKEFAKASAKYTQAIKLDGSNAILYANRAACHLNLKRYLDAANDAKEAIKIDPSYTKAHARLATAQDFLGECWHSVKSWEDALKTLSKDNLTPSEAKQKDQYEACLVTAKQMKAKLESGKGRNDIFTTLKAGEYNESDFPWIRAQKLLPELMRQGEYRSSAYVITGAYESFEKAMNILRSQVVSAGNVTGKVGAIVSLSNAIMRDERVFILRDSDYIQMFNQQIGLELNYTGAIRWADIGLEAIKKGVPAALATEGWDKLRPQLSLLVRGWILRGFHEAQLRSNHVLSCEMLTQAVDFIEWGREVWKDHPMAQRGTIFEITFLRGVRTLRLNSLMKICPPPSAEPSRELKALLKEADLIIADVKENPMPQAADPSQVGHLLAFYDYCEGQALSMKAMYHKQRAIGIKDDDDQRSEDFLEASTYYTAAALCYPEDDEYRSWFLSCAIDNAWRVGKIPIGLPLDLMDKMNEAKPKMLRIWKDSPFARQGRDTLIATSMEREKNLRNALSNGLTRDDFVGGQWGSD